MTRKIDKRACRKLAMPELKFNLNEGVLHVESCPYIIRTAVRNIAGQRMVMVADLLCAAQLISAERICVPCWVSTGPISPSCGK